MKQPSRTNNTILVSACLIGMDCRFNGKTKHNQAVLDYLVEQGLTAIPVCPEQMAGLPTPREATRFRTGNGADVLAGQGEVVSITGKQMNDVFRKGADEVLKVAQICGCLMALFKERSPSCGVHEIDRNGKMVSGMGVTTARLLAEGFSVLSEEDISNQTP